MNDRMDWPLLARYLAGECSPEEMRAVDDWVRADPARRQQLDVLRRIWAASEEPPAEKSSGAVGLGERREAEEDWMQVARHMQAAEPSGTASRHARPVAAPLRRASRAPQRSRRKNPRTVPRGVGVAVALLLLVGGAWLAMQAGFSFGDASPASAWREIVTERGERAKIQLADGTQVTLNVDSRLRLPSTFDRDLRQVYLQGEAYFDVASDSSRPFIVRAEKATVEVHGTAFGVRSYPEDHQVEVAVAEGAVSMRAETSSAQEAKLTAGQLGRFSEKEDRVTTRAVKVNTYLGWTEGQLVFDNTALPQVAHQLGRWYDLDFELQDASLRSLHLTATLNSTSVRDVMDVIAASLGIEYRIDGNKVILMDRSARSAAIGFAPRSA